MKSAKLKNSLHPIESVTIIHSARAVSMSTREMALSSPRTNLAYSFWLCWRWLKNKIKKNNA